MQKNKRSCIKNKIKISFLFIKKKMIPLYEEENKSYEEQDVSTYVEKSLIQVKKTKSIKKSKIIAITLENVEVLLIIIVI